ncbi:hypothetical protein AB0F91_42085 [Amycolatopsis sp. NPDC023774]|uniref:hypothetical protein n=1 Tax=Amycolatopsis sp. NPDC023774 TaxID=3155015 RepID=UPI0033DC102D
MSAGSDENTDISGGRAGSDQATTASGADETSTTGTSDGRTGSDQATTPNGSAESGASETSGGSTGSDQTAENGASSDSTSGDSPATGQTATPSSNGDQTTEAPLLATASRPQGDLLGGLLGMVDATLHSITEVAGTVGGVGETVLPPVTTVPGEDDAPSLIPIGDVLGPVFSGGTVSGGVTVTVPELTAQPAEVVSTVVPVVVPQPAPVTVPKAAALVHYPSGVHLIPVQQRSTGARHANNENSHVGATGGGGSGGGGGLPAAPSAPVAPTTTANPSHDGSGGARQPFAVVGDSVTTTQLKLIGVSRDHEVDGAGRDAALPTTSPD